MVVDHTEPGRALPFIPAPVLLIAALSSRSYRLALTLTLPIFLLLYLYYPYLLPVRVSSTGSPTLSVMTYNILFSNTDYEALTQVILTYRPDFVALQEVQPEAMAALKERLGLAYPFAEMASENPYGTTALFSHHPLSETLILDLGADRPAVVTTAMIDGEPITVISAHLLAYGLQWVPWPDIPAAIRQKTSAQNEQVRRLLAEIERRAGLVILACNCNSKETSSTYRILNTDLTNAARSATSGNGTRPVGTRRDVALQHIDYLFYRGELQVLGVYQVADRGGSDHRPVLAVFEKR